MARRIGERTFTPDGDAEGEGDGEVWPNPNAAGTYYDTARGYDLLGNPPHRADRRHPATL